MSERTSIPHTRPTYPQSIAVPHERGRLIAHRIATGVFLAASFYSLLLIWALLGGPVAPETLIPFARPVISLAGLGV